MSESLEKALYIVPTPIGNMKDVTERAVEVLCGADVICAEDTRHSLPFLEHIGVKSPKLISFHDHNEAEKAEITAEKIENGETLALISDAGTPLISDPGFHLVRECVRRGIRVIPLPGPCAVITALSASGMPTDRFCFEGFLPVKEKSLREKLTNMKKETRTMVFYETPRRMPDTSLILGEIFGDREVCVGREMTKTFETFYHTTAAKLHDVLQTDKSSEKGEMVLIVAPYREEEHAGAVVPDDALNLIALLKEELPPRKVAEITAKMFNLRKNDLYQLISK